MKDVFSKLMKNPSKLMGLVKTVGDKLDSKLKSGELKESEMIQEATEIMNKMKNMPGMGNIQSMLSKMSMGGLGGGKVNTNAMEAQLNQRFKMAKTKERIRAKAEANAASKAASQLQPQQTTQPKMSDEEILKFIESENKPERTPRGAKPNQPSNKKKKGKK